MIMNNIVGLASQPQPGEDGADFGPTIGSSPRASTLMLGAFLPGLLDDVLTGQPPPEYQFTTEPWGTLALRPRQITCIGGPPNTGKTALMLLMVTGALLLNPELRAIFACVEMGERILMERVLARLSRVFLGKILKRDRDEFFAERVESVRAQMESMSNRLMFIKPPFTMLDVRAAYDEFEPQIVALDYLQRIPADLTITETRQQVTLTMTAVRALAEQGPAVIAAAALNRQASSRSQSRAEATDDSVNDLAAFRDSSDIEYSVDDAFVLAKCSGNVVTRHGDEYRPKKLVLRHVKSRNSLTMDVPLLFDGRVQDFQLRPWEDQEQDGPRVATPPRPHPARGWQTDNFMEGGDGTEFV